MPRRARTLGIVAAASVIAFGCNLLTGASDLEIRSDKATADGGDGDGGSESGSTPATACVAPGGYAGLCMRDRDGWSPVVLPSAGSACPPDYASPVELRGAETAADRCDCTCAPNTGSCDGPFTLDYGNDGCSLGSTTVSFPPDGGCLGNVPNINGRVKLSRESVGAPSGCGPIVTRSFTPIATIKTCSGARPTPSSECDAVSACYPAPPPGSQACIVHEGETSCPPGFDRRTVAGVTAVDGRTCTPCTCTDNGCAGARVQLYLDDKCNLPLGSVEIDKCQAQLPGASPNGASYRAPSGCTTTKAPGSGVSGGVTFEGARTICCR